ncbi:hypothetical protein DYB35_005364 [Aphanomyces astaci]|uniref:Uncharacterized protein n=1 Tax=Aphanomyces astaci TaxID=112090 RepID=A0A3R6XS43_APHAT|nr:hypothetical protein DYB35_005364 [Aphanomyces astaci]
MHHEQHFLPLGAPVRPPQHQQHHSSSQSPPSFSPAHSHSHTSQPNPYFQPSRISPPKYPTDGFVSNAQRLSSPPFHAAAAANGRHPNDQFDSDSICESANSANSHNNLWVTAMESSRTDSATKPGPITHQDTASLWDDDDSNARGSGSSYNRGDSFMSGSNGGGGSFNYSSEHIGDVSPFAFGTPAPDSGKNSITL